jgi:hypothetical protein
MFYIGTTIDMWIFVGCYKKILYVHLSDHRIVHLVLPEHALVPRQS